MRRLLSEFIICLREKPFSYKIAYCRELGDEVLANPEPLWSLYERTEYLMARVVITDAVRRHGVEVPDTFLRHITAMGNRYQLKNLLMVLRKRRSLHTLMRAARHPLMQDDPLLRHLLIQAAHAHSVDPNTLDIYVNTEEGEASAEDQRIWSLWRPLDELIAHVNDSAGVTTDTLRLMLWDNNPLLAEELARDLADVFNFDPSDLQMLDRRQLISLLAKYIDLSYQLCKALAEGEFESFETRLNLEDRTQPPSVLLPSEHTDQVPRAKGLGSGGRSAGESEDEEHFPEEDFVEESDEEETEGDTLTVDDLTFDPIWKQLIPRMLAEELLIVPLHVEGDPPQSITIGSGNRDQRSVSARLAHLDCKIHFIGLPERLLREAIERFYS